MQLLHEYAINSPNSRQNCKNIDVLALITEKFFHIKYVQNAMGGHGYGKERIHDNTRGTEHASRQRHRLFATGEQRGAFTFTQLRAEDPATVAVNSNALLSTIRTDSAGLALI